MTQARLITVTVALALIALLTPWAAGDSDADEYKVANGETLSEIAERHGMTVEELAQANGIVNPDLILSGQVLVVPGAAGGPIGISGTGITSASPSTIRCGSLRPLAWTSATSGTPNRSAMSLRVSPA